MPDRAKIDWLKEIDFDKKEGEIRIVGERCTILNSNAFRDYREAIAEVMGHKAADTVIYMAARRHIEDYISSVLKSSLVAGLAKKLSWGKKKIAENICTIITHYGFGHAEIDKLDLEGESVVILRESCIASAYKKKQDVPVCSYISGQLSGGLKAITGKPYNVTETRCMAMGDNECRFVIKRDKK